MTHKNSSMVTITLLSLVLSACSGGGSQNTQVETDVESSEPEIPASISESAPKVALSDHPKIVISSETSEEIMRDVHSVITKQFKTMRGIIQDIDLEKGASLNLLEDGGDQTVSESLDCERGGTWELTFTRGENAYSDALGYSVSGPGASNQQRFRNCGSEYYKAPYVLFGTTNTKVISGFYDNFSILSHDTSLRDTFEHFVVTSSAYDNNKTEFAKYSHGTINILYDDLNVLHYQGEFFAEKDPNSFDFNSDLQLHNFDFETNAIPGIYSWDTIYNVVERQGFDLDLVVKNQRLNIQVQNALVFDDSYSKFVSGTVEISSQTGIIIFDYFKDYIEYKIDADEDGDFEETGIIDKSSL